MHIEVVIEGVTPLICNRFTELSELQVSNGTSAVLRGKKGTPREQAEPKCYRDKQARFTIPGNNLFKAIIDGGAFIKNGKSKLSTQKSSLVPSFLSMLTTDAVLTDKGNKPLRDFEVDSRSVVIPSTGGRIMAHRPRFDEWRLAFDLDLTEAECDPKLARELVDNAGRKVGLGDFRPARKGPFGRFKVVGWRELP